jgi:hypothetical protein
LVSGANRRAVKSSCAVSLAAVVIAQYKAFLAPKLDRQPAAKVLASATAGTKAISGIGGTSKQGVVGTFHYELMTASRISFAFGYVKGALLVEIVGLPAAGVEAFIRAYLKAVGR